MQKILVISNTSFSIEKFRAHYLNKLALNNNIKLITPQKKPNNIRKIQFNKINDNNIYNTLKSLFKNISKFKPDKIIVYSFKYQFLISLIGIFNKSKLIFIIAGKGSMFLMKNPILKFIKNIIMYTIFFRANEVFFINPYDKLFFENNYKIFGNSHLIPTEGINADQKVRKTNKKRKFLFFGRIIKEKGVNDYLKAADILKKKFPRLTFYIAGPMVKKSVGESHFLQGNLKKQILRNKNVKYLGFLKNYKKIYSKIDCLISPSFSEGAGTSVLEALSCGLFVIGYSNNGHNYILKNTGNLICKKNNHNSIVDSVELFLKLDKKKIDLAKKKSITKIKKNFNSEIVIKLILKVINSKN